MVILTRNVQETLQGFLCVFNSLMGGKGDVC